jgi:hypothetical protein
VFLGRNPVIPLFKIYPFWKFFLNPASSSGKKIRGQRKKENWRNPILSCDSVYSFSNYECDPLSPPKGEATQGERPLDPLINFHLPSAGLSQRGDAQTSVVDASDAVAPKSDLDKTYDFYRAKKGELENRF